MTPQSPYLCRSAPAARLDTPLPYAAPMPPARRSAAAGASQLRRGLLVGEPQKVECPMPNDEWQNHRHGNRGSHSGMSGRSRGLGLYETCRNLVGHQALPLPPFVRRRGQRALEGAAASAPRRPRRAALQAIRRVPAGSEGEPRRQVPFRYVRPQPGARLNRRGGQNPVFLSAVSLSLSLSVSFSSSPRFPVLPFPRFPVSPFPRFPVSPSRRFPVSPSRRLAVSPFPRFPVSPSRRLAVSPFPRLAVS